MIKVEGIVLKKKQLLGQDIFLTLFSKEHGKVFAIAKGSKKLTSRRSPHIQTANLIEALLNDTKDIYYLQETRLISGFVQIKKDEQKVQYMYAFFFILDRVLPERQKEETVYALTKSFLIKMSKSERFTQVNFASYLYNLLHVLGYVDEEKSLAELIRTTESIIAEKIPLDII